MTHKPIRDIGKRFEIILYHLERIQEDWGQCRGLSANDVCHLRIGAHAEIKRLSESSKISPFYESPFIPEEEFDNRPQASTVLEDENKELREELSRCRSVISNIQKQFE